MPYIGDFGLATAVAMVLAVAQLAVEMGTESGAAEDCYSSTRLKLTLVK